MKSRAKILIKGIVQGVGFRPFIYNLANAHSLNGWVLNSTEGVSIEVEGEKETLATFIDEIPKKTPPLAMIDSVDVEHLPLIGYETFVIRHSEGDRKTKPSVSEANRSKPKVASLAKQSVKISPDVCTCDDCKKELFDVQDRRYRYPFLNCTNCGPRFTIIEDIPYDREKTTMRKFKMCPLCQAEYDDPTNRRFHAQPNACAECGPSVTIEDKTGPIECNDPIRETIKLLKEGKIIAVKGLGGFHLACDAENDDAVAILRKRKRRTFKPFAIMSLNINKIRQYCCIEKEEKQLLESVQRPIVLLKKLENCSISEFVAPNNNYLGVMFPYTPLHYLLLDLPAASLAQAGEDNILALVMTSGNISEEPIAIDNIEAKTRLADLADYFLMHNRDIRMRCDDSVSFSLNGQEFIIRRSRGYAPSPIDLNFSMQEVLACGPELKNTFCLTKENHAFLSQHIGDLQNIEAFNYYQDAIEHFKRLFRINPKIVAYDLHPEYLSTKYALAQENVRTDAFGLPRLVGVQHHHAHVVSCMAENGLLGRRLADSNVSSKVIGVACDGTGYGVDGAIWGCEFLLADESDFRRCAHLKYIPLPAGDVAIKEPYRMAISYLYSAFDKDFLSLDTPLLKRLDKKRLTMILRMIERGINSPLTSSCGRLFDAVSSLIGLKDVTTYEAQAAIELEMVADANTSDVYGYNIENEQGGKGARGQEGKGARGQAEIRNPKSEDGVDIIDVRKMFCEIVSDLQRCVPKKIISAKFHNTVADFIVETCERIRAKNNIDEVVLSGGVFQNRYLITKVLSQLRARKFTPYFHRRVPTNDGGISLGQAVIANKVAGML
ncbi:MAG: carbamoyltransferase HypF [Deltaproteobacteria bacterium]|nr:carbamoyltransferase HypF [Deltaproteobacteria bacterium]